MTFKTACFSITLERCWHWESSVRRVGYCYQHGCDDVLDFTFIVLRHFLSRSGCGNNHSFWMLGRVFESRTVEAEHRMFLLEIFAAPCWWRSKLHVCRISDLKFLTEFDVEICRVSRGLLRELANSGIHRSDIHTFEKFPGHNRWCGWLDIRCDKTYFKSLAFDIQKSTFVVSGDHSGAKYWR